MTVQSTTTAGKISKILHRGVKDTRKPGVSPKFIKNILSSAKSQSSQGSNIKAR